jgi:Leucine-rich repeat (LRR) protein
MGLRQIALVLLAGIAWAEESDRRVAEFTVAQGGRVKIHGRAGWIAHGRNLPAGDYRVEIVDWLAVNADPPDLERLGGLRHLRALHLGGPFWNRNADTGRDGSAQMKYLAPVTTLETLTFSDHFLDRIRFRDQGLDAIAALTGLRELRVRQANIRGPGLRHFVNLESLDIELCPVGDEGFQSVKGMQGLKRLWAGDTAITDAGLTSLAGLVHLELLDLHGTAITDAGLTHLKGLRGLRRLNLMGAEVTDAGLETILGFRELEELNLYRTKVSNAGLARLAELRHLREVDLRYSRVTRAGVETLTAALPAVRVRFAESSARAEPPAGVEKLAPAEWLEKLGAKLARERGEVVEISLARAAVRDGGLAKLAAFPKLRKLNLSATEIGDTGMAHIAALPELRELNLNSTAVSAAGLRQLQRLGALHTLEIRNTYVEGDFEWMPRLEHVDASGSPVGNAAIPRLAALPKLRTLVLSSTEVADGAALDGLKTVEHLDLSATDLTNSGLERLKGLTQLRVLILRDARFTDTGLTSLAALKGLRVLDLNRTRISDKGMAALAGLTGLTHLSLDYGEIYDAGLKQLAPLAGLEQLSLDNTHITDASVSVLSGFTKLRELNLYHTLVTAEGHAQLRKALPECRFVWDADSARPTRRRS